jgi:SAM-dependent methyltransferase
MVREDRTSGPALPVSKAVLASVGAELRPGARVLDFGCGAGRLVRIFREAGFDAEGVDLPLDSLAETWQSYGDDARYLHHASEEGDFPFPSASFDFSYSTSVLEHVKQLDKAVSEIARVMKPGAYSLHMFPARWRPIEPHVRVPFGGRFNSRNALQLWARLGVRNDIQKASTPKQVVDGNLKYFREEINYTTAAEMEAVFGRHFSDVSFVERAFVRATVDHSRTSRVMSRFIGLPGAEAFYRSLHTRVLLARR